MPRLSSLERGRAIGQLQVAGVKQNVVAARFGVMSQYNDYEVHYECFIPNVSSRMFQE